MTEHTLTASRRDVIKASSTVAMAAALGISPAVKRVSATASNNPELTALASIPSDSAIEIEVLELETQNSETALNRDTATIQDGEETYVLHELGDDPEHYYDFKIGLGTEGDSPTFDTLSLEVPVPPPEPGDFPTVSHDATSWDAKPSDTQVVYDEYRLRKYQPKVDLSQQMRRETEGMYGFIAESDSESTYACCYWLLLPEGDSPMFANPNSELGGHIPIYVFVDAETDEVDQIVYATWQWMAADLEPSEETLTQGRTDYPTHASFEVVEPFNVLDSLESGGGHFTDLKSLPDDRAAWVNNGWYDSASAAAIENPWTMLDSSREGWWDSSSAAGRMIGISRRLGSAGGEEADSLRAGSADGFFSFDFDFKIDFWPFNDDDSDS